MVAKRKGVSRLIAKGSAHPKVSPSRSAAEGTRRVAHQKDKLSSALWLNGLLKPSGNVGQHIKHNRRPSAGQLLTADLNKKILVI